MEGKNCNKLGWNMNDPSLPLTIQWSPYNNGVCSTIGSFVRGLLLSLLWWLFGLKIEKWLFENDRSVTAGIITPFNAKEV